MKTAKELAQQAQNFRNFIDAHLPRPSPMIKANALGRGARMM